ncbi:DNA-processing protein DprA [Lysobacter humi (ex Lee et al. 2017)]
MPEPALALVALAACGGPLAPRRALLEGAAGPVEALADPAGWSVAGLDAAQRSALRTPDRDVLAAAEAWFAQPGRRVIGWTDPDYPPALRAAANPPVAVFVAGDIGLLWRPAVAVVGSRGPTPGGREHAAEFAAAFARAGLVVGSGLAAGIDTAAHRAALRHGATFAVLGTGPDIAYPRTNADLHAELCASGAVLSEHVPGTGPRREHFPSRNRLLAALCLGTVVIEAAERSGALITARLAADAGREVFALPGSIRNPLARGCHRLIRDGAQLVQSPDEVIEILAPSAAREAEALQNELFPSDAWKPPRGAPGDTQGALPPDHDTLWNALGFDPTDMDQLAERSGLTPSRLSSMLLVMELEGRVAQQHGRFYRVA